MDTFIELYLLDGSTFHCDVENENSIRRALINPDGLIELESMGRSLVVKESLLVGYIITNPANRKVRIEHHYKLEKEEEKIKREMEYVQD